ncbi:MAG TPA: hypothetical protein VG367_02340 [Mucilaginibacter sp.]|jgi:hypothetical protein|nr:hypothetical protein [Mucilaginibacter sp.]
MPYTNQNLNPQGAVKALPIIHLALIAGQVLFCLVAYFQFPQKDFSMDGSKDPFVYVAVILAAGGFFLGSFLFRQQVGKIGPENSLSQKISAYQTAFILRAALAEGPSLFSVVAFMLSGNLLFLAITGAIILYFLSFRPTREKVSNDLNLDYNEKAELDGQPAN